MARERDGAWGERSVERVDPTDDALFYAVPRLVVHIDDGAIGAVGVLAQRLIQPGAVVLDLMSSYRSHLPDELALAEVVGLGMNADELAANPCLTERLVHDLNREPGLPFGDSRFDAVLCTVSVQYLTRPVEVFREVRRVLREGAPFLVTFSNRCFPAKAIRAWRERDDAGHVELVREYFRESKGWTEPEVAAHRPRGGDPLYGVWAKRSPKSDAVLSPKCSVLRGPT